MNRREKAAAKVVQMLDGAFLRALSEPARLQVLRVLLTEGPSDIASIAAHFPQDRSVVSRHLKVLHEAGIVRAHKQGRHRIYDIDGPAFVETLEHIAAEARRLYRVCCP